MPIQDSNPQNRAPVLFDFSKINKKTRTFIEQNPEGSKKLAELIAAENAKPKNTPAQNTSPCAKK